MNEFYVYVHRRASDNLPFYVGKGKDKRAWSQSPRSAFWKNVKTKHGLIVEIVFDNLSEEEAFQCEKDTILEFRYFGYPLVNLTNGGEGASGFRHTGDSLVRLQKHIKHQSDLQRDKQTYTFYHLDGSQFTGTRVEFSVYTGIKSNIIAKLFQSRNTRKSIKNWSLKPIQLRTPTRPLHVSPQRRNGNIDKNIYAFYHLSGEKFIGTRQEFGDYSQIALSRLASLFCKNPRRSVFGWALKEISMVDYTHLKT